MKQFLLSKKEIRHRRAFRRSAPNWAKAVKALSLDGWGASSSGRDGGGEESWDCRGWTGSGTGAGEGWWLAGFDFVCWG